MENDFVVIICCLNGMIVIKLNRMTHHQMMSIQFIFNETSMKQLSNSSDKILLNKNIYISDDN